MIKKVFFLLICCLFWSPVFSQKPDSLNGSRYSLNIGIGWSHYFNSLETGRENVEPDHVVLGIKGFWEPGYRLSLGIETGYYRIFRYTVNNDTQQATIDYTAIPLMLVARMRVINRFHLSTGTGVTMIRNRLSSDGENRINTIWSLSSYQFSCSYIYPVGKLFRLTGEAGTLYIGKTDDWTMYIQGVFSIIF